MVDENLNEGFDSQSHRKEDWNRMFRENLENARTYGKTAFDRVDRSARENPWYVIAGAGLGAALIGYLLGRSSSSSRDEIITYTYDEEFDGAFDE
ncbi:MAG TPA: DUF883 C-terminal domain-containing protein [Bdellovibrionales bacterium]|nr:DUF883 C-terminal domain-containing protein [Bdellovibrionales bacterium]